MLRQSLRLFVLIALVGFAATVGYAALSLRGPHEALGEAAGLMERGEYARAVNVLDLCERSQSLQRDPALLDRLRRMRYEANSRLRNPAGALRDVEHLLREGSETAADPALLLDRVRLLAQTGQGELALLHARRFLAEHKPSGRAFELAGEACQASYQAELRAVADAVAAGTGATAAKVAQSALLAWLYRPEGEADDGLERMRAIYAEQARLAGEWPRLLQRLRDLRVRVQEATGFFQQSLELPGQPVAAFRGLALSLDQAERADDLAMLCEIYRRRFDHQYVATAGGVLALALLRDGLDAAAIAAARRFLPPGAWKERLAKSRLGQVADLLLARAVAAFRLRDQKELGELLREAQAIHAADAPQALVLTTATGLLGQLTGNAKVVETQLRAAIAELSRGPVPIGQPDLLAELVPLRMAAMRGGAFSDDQILAVLAGWAAARPADPEPRLHRARFLLEQGKAPGALAALQEAEPLEPRSERLLRLHAAIADVVYRDSEQDGPGLLAHCRRRESTTPEVPAPIGYLTCASAALAAGAPEIARDSARAAIDGFPWSRWPRLLEAEAELALGRPAAADELLGKLLQLLPPDAETMAAAIRARRARGAASTDLLARAIRLCAPTPEVAAELLRAALADADAAAMPLAERVAADRKAGPELQVLAARALARGGRLADAHRLLEAVATAAGTAGTGTPASGAQAAFAADLAAAATAWLEATAETTPDEHLERATRLVLQRFALQNAAAAPALLRLAETFAESRPRTAYALLCTVLAAADPEQRHGGELLLAGRLALRLGLPQLAEQHWTAALAFADGRAAAEPLARLCFAQGRAERALAVYRLVEQPTDAALALRAGAAAAGERQALAQHRRDAGDLLAHAVLHALDRLPAAAPAAAAPAAPPAPPADEARRQQILELAATLADASLGAQSLVRAKALADAEPQATLPQLLLARALRDAGRGADADAVHRALFAKGVDTPVFWREVVEAAAADRRELPDDLGAALDAAIRAGAAADSPSLRFHALRRTAGQMQRAGHAQVAAQIHAHLWLELPELSEPTVDDAVRLAEQGHANDALAILDRLWRTLPRAERAHAVDRMIAIADPLARAGALPGALTYHWALQATADLGPIGSAVHYLLDHGALAPDVRVDDARANELLRGQLLRFAAGHDALATTRRTIERLRARLGADAALEAVDQALAAHPASLPLWHERTVLMAQTNRARIAVDELRSVLAYSNDPAATLGLVCLAGLERCLVPADAATLAALPKELLATPAGQLAQGLVALRSGRPDAALPFLERAEPRDDGAHLALHALALLQSGAEAGPARAAAVLAKLQQDYPSSSLARYAGSFARQLGSR
jgi:hypothetical protein